MSARERILGRIRAAVEAREAGDHPGPFGGWRPDPSDDGPERPTASDAFSAFERAFTAVGGEVVEVAGSAAAAAWVEKATAAVSGFTVGQGVPETLVPPGTQLPPDQADLAISWGRGAVAETGTVILESSDGRRTQLLAPTHVVLVARDAVHPTLSAALTSLRAELPSALGLHSGPSRSADIGQVMVRGVHGPGRIVALVVGRGDSAG